MIETLLRFQLARAFYEGLFNSKIFTGFDDCIFQLDPIVNQESSYDYQYLIYSLRCLFKPSDTYTYSNANTSLKN